MAGDFTGHAVQGAVDEAVGEAPARGLLHQPLHTRAADMGSTRVLKSGNYDLTPIFPPIFPQGLLEERDGAEVEPGADQAAIGQHTVRGRVHAQRAFGGIGVGGF